MISEAMSNGPMQLLPGSLEIFSICYQYFSGQCHLELRLHAGRKSKPHKEITCSCPSLQAHRSPALEPSPPPGAHRVNEEISNNSNLQSFESPLAGSESVTPTCSIQTSYSQALSKFLTHRICECEMIIADTTEYIKKKKENLITPTGRQGSEEAQIIPQPLA